MRVEVDEAGVGPRRRGAGGMAAPHETDVPDICALASTARDASERASERERDRERQAETDGKRRQLRAWLAAARLAASRGKAGARGANEEKIGAGEAIVNNTAGGRRPAAGSQSVRRRQRPIGGGRTGQDETRREREEGAEGVVHFLSPSGLGLLSVVRRNRRTGLPNCLLAGWLAGLARAGEGITGGWGREKKGTSAAHPPTPA